MGRSKPKTQKKGEVFGAGVGGFLRKVGDDDDPNAPSGRGDAPPADGEGGANCGFGGKGKDMGAAADKKNKDEDKKQEVLRFGAGGSLQRETPRQSGGNGRREVVRFGAGGSLQRRSSKKKMRRP